MTILSVHRNATDGLIRMFRQKRINASARAVVRGSRFLSYDIRLKNPLQYNEALAIAEPLALALGVPSIASYRDMGIIRFDITLPKSYWVTVYYNEMIAPYQVGTLPGNKPLSYNLSDPNQMIVGVPGSGKSEGIKTILLSSLIQNSPDRLGVVLIDPHKAIVEFDNASNLLLPPATEKDGIADALNMLRDTLNDRKSVGEAVVKANPDVYPLVMLVIDEASEPNVLGAKDYPNKENIALVQQLAKEGRKFNMRMLLGTQKPTEADLPGIMSMFPVRYVGQVTDARMASNFAGKKEVPAHLLTGNGDFFRARGNELVRFQFALTTPEDYTHLKTGDIRPVTKRVEYNSGRPAVDLSPGAIAYYLAHNKVTLKTAKEVLNLTRTGHEKHREFAMQVSSKLKEYDIHW